MIRQTPAVIHETTPGGSTPLHIAAGINDPDGVRLLVSRGARLEAATARGLTPLHVAATMGATESAAALLAAGASTSATNPAGATPLLLAVRKEAPETVGVLVQARGVVYIEAFIDARTVQGRRALESGDLEKARKLFSGLLRRHPDSEAVNFAYGIACLSLKDYSRAEMAFERITSQLRPDNQRARRELAQIYSLTGRGTLARQELEIVLKSNPPEHIRQAVQLDLKNVKTTRSRWLVSGRGTGGAVYDSNVNSGPNGDLIEISPILVGGASVNSLRVDGTSRPIDATGFFASGEVEAGYDVGAPGEWVMFGAADAYGNFLGSASDYETRMYDLYVGGRRGTRSSLLSVPVTASWLDYGGEPLMSYVGMAPQFLKSTGTGGIWWWITGADVQMRDYDTLDSRDGIFVSLVQTAKRFFGPSRHDLYVTLEGLRDMTDAEFYDYQGLGGTLGGDYMLPGRSALYAYVRWTHKAYAEPEPLAPEERVDDVLQWFLGARKRFGAAWETSLEFQHSDTASTFDLYDMTRDVVTLSGTYAF